MSILESSKALRKESPLPERWGNGRPTLYTAYGLVIHSEIPLPELPPGSGMATVSIRLGKVDRVHPAKQAEADGFWQLGDQDCLFWPEFGAFGVRSGREITVDPAPAAQEEDLRVAVLGPALAILLHQRGAFVLHASAVAIDGHAVGFVGDRGWGKSTMAAALYARGHELLADDIVVLSTGKASVPVVLPGFPQLKLSPEAAAFCLQDDPASLRPLVAGYEKRARPVKERFAAAPCPLQRIYVLGGGERREIEPLGHQEAMLQLIRHSYVARHGSQLLKGSGARAHLRHCAEVVKKVPVRRLKREASLPALPLLAQMVEEDLLGEGREG